jgi:uncharacterized protein
VPQRLCVVCRTGSAKRALVRLVRAQGGVRVDPTGKAAGRGAYLCAAAACWSAPGLRGRLDAALKSAMSDADYAAVQAFGATLSDVP